MLPVAAFGHTYANRLTALHSTSGEEQMIFHWSCRGICR